MIKKLRSPAKTTIATIRKLSLLTMLPLASASIAQEGISGGPGAIPSTSFPGGGGGDGGGVGFGSAGGGFASEGSGFGSEGGFGALGGVGFPDLLKYNFDGVVRVTYQISVDGVVTNSKSMAGLIVALNPLTITTCASIVDDNPLVNMPSDATRSFRFEHLELPMPDYVPGGGGPSAGFGGMPSSPRLQEVMIKNEQLIVASGLAFITDYTAKFDESVGRFKPIDLTRPIVSKSQYADQPQNDFQLSKSAVPELVDREARQDGAISIGPDGFESLYCGGKDVKRQDILNAFLESRQQRGSIIGIDVAGGAPDSLSARGLPSAESSDESSSIGMMYRAMRSLQNRSNFENSQSSQEPIVDLIVQVKTAKDEAAKQTAMEELRRALTVEFDARQALKANELQTMRARLEKLEQERQEATNHKQQEIQQRLEQLIAD